MNTMLRFALCLLLAGLLAPAPVSLANDEQADQTAKQEKSSVRQFSDAELSAARETLAALTPAQRTMINHLRYLMSPEYENELMAGRAFAPSMLLPYEQPASELESGELLRLWAVLASGMPATDATGRWLAAFVEAPLPPESASLGELGLQMAICARGVQRPEFALVEKLSDRAEGILDATTKARRATDGDSPLIVGKSIDPAWFANQMWRGLICRLALQLDLKVSERVWETGLRDLIAAGDKNVGWRSTPTSAGESNDLDTNLLAITALSLAATAPEDSIGKGLARSVEKNIERAPGVLKRLETDYAAQARTGTKLALILSMSPDLAPEGTAADSWRKSLVQPALDGNDPGGMVTGGGNIARALGLASNRHSIRVCETALQCVALSGGLMGNKTPLSELGVAGVGRAMYAFSVLHANTLPEGRRRIYSGDGHVLPEAREIEDFMLKGLDYLIETQQSDGSWGSAWGNRSGKAGTGDPGTTSIVALALIRAGHSPFAGEHKDTVLKATKNVLEAVENASEDGPLVTETTGTQLQGKLGKIIDTAMATQFLARVLPLTEPDKKLNRRIEAALDKCIVKIVAAQDKDGGWITQGWAPVIQSAMFNQALELAQLAGRDVDTDVLARSRIYLARDVEVESGKTAAEPAAKRPVISAGVAFYSGSSAMRSTAADAAEITIAMERAKKEGVLPTQAEVDEKNLRKIGYSSDAATLKATAYLQHQTLLEKLNDEKYLKGFGNNGGEEFISYMMSSESLVITGGETWSDWNDKLHNTFEKIQNADGSWSGHHCISSPVICTAAILLCLTADREVHVVVETGPAPAKTSSKPAPKKKEDKKSDDPVTGKK